MVETKTCSFTGKPIPPGTGMMYVKKTGQVLFGKEVRGKQRVSIESESGEISNYLIPFSMCYP